MFNRNQINQIMEQFVWENDSIADLVFILLNKLCNSKSSLAGHVLSIISTVLPLAFSVAGSILVIKLGWRLFRNFTKG